MSKHLGDYDAAAVIFGKFTSYQPSTGTPFTLAGTPALSVYKDNSTTQSTSGVTLTASFDSVTGLNHFAIDTSSDGSFYSAGSFFDIVITTGTVDGVSVVGSCIASFTIRKDSSLKPTTAGRTLVVDSAGLADATTVKLGPSGSGTAQTARDVGLSVLISSGTGTGQLSVTSGVVDANTTKVSGTAQTGRDLGASVLLSSGTGTGQVLLSSGKVSIVASDIGAVWDVTLASHVGAGSTGLALSSASAAGDPWNTPLPGAYASGTAGNIVGNNLNATVSSRLASASYTAPPTAAENFAAVLKGDWTGLTGEASYSLLNAARFLRNKVTLSGATLTVKKEDGTTNAWTGTVTTDSLALPVTSVTPT